MNLPTDVARLRQVLQEWTRRSGRRADDESLYTQATSLLSQLPTTPRLLAAEERDARALTSWTALTASGWTDARPALPTRIIGP
ncbi:hypothetical protein ACIHFD_29155 [Nonomuraea sp. NPDC051941]|uniref:hypothetical protein n=1 Tax=Nonomuraea sp. NPDC051941 TaxID=3364373 RepID=UPI0037C810CD